MTKQLQEIAEGIHNFDTLESMDIDLPPPPLPPSSRSPSIVHSPSPSSRSPSPSVHSPSPSAHSSSPNDDGSDASDMTQRNLDTTLLSAPASGHDQESASTTDVSVDELDVESGLTPDMRQELDRTLRYLENKWNELGRYPNEQATFLAEVNRFVEAYIPNEESLVSDDNPSNDTSKEPHSVVSTEATNPTRRNAPSKLKTVSKGVGYFALWYLIDALEPAIFEALEMEHTWSPATVAGLGIIVYYIGRRVV